MIDRAEVARGARLRPRRTSASARWRPGLSVGLRVGVGVAVRLGLGLGLLAATAAGCKGGGASPTADGATADGAGADAAILCPAGGAAGELADAGDDGGLVAGDEFGPNAPAAKTPSSLGRVNVYEVTAATRLERVDIYLAVPLPQTRITIAVQEAAARTTPFQKLADIQLSVDACQGWATSGPLAIALEPGRFYAIGFDPNQALTAFVSTDGDSLPIDGAFGRLIGSKTATSVSVPTITWDKFTDKEYARQRLLTSRRAPTSVDGSSPPEGGTDGPRDGGTDGAADSSATDSGATDGARG